VNEGEFMDRKEKAILITLAANIALIVMLFWLAAVSGSIGLEASAWHSFLDVFVSLVVFIGLIASRLMAPHSKALRQRVENILAIFVSLFIFYMGVEILMDALGNEQTELTHIPFAAAGAFISVIVNYLMARYKIYVGRQTDSQSLIAEGYHSRMDMFCSLAVLAGLIGALFGMNLLDKVAALIALVLTVISGFEILIENVKMLLRLPKKTKGDNSGSGDNK
jgi:membrane protease subunit HflK